MVSTLTNPVLLPAFSLSISNVFNTQCPVESHPFPQSSKSLHLALVSDEDIRKAIKRRKPSLSVALDDIPGFNIKGCSEIFVPVLRHIFNLSLTLQQFPAPWKEVAVVPVFKSEKSRLCMQLQTH
jgi:hypothetical protein